MWILSFRHGFEFEEVDILGLTENFILLRGTRLLGEVTTGSLGLEWGLRLDMRKAGCCSWLDLGELLDRFRLSFIYFRGHLLLVVMRLCDICADLPQTLKGINMRIE